MSMWLDYAKLSPELLEKVKATPEPLINALWFGEGEVDGVSESDLMGLDYRTLMAICEGLEEAGMDTTWTYRATGDEFGDVIDFEVTYGLVFYFTPSEVAQIAAGLAEEDWDPEDDYEENIARFFATAAGEGKAVIGGVS